MHVHYGTEDTVEASRLQVINEFRCITPSGDILTLKPNYLVGHFRHR